MKIRIKRLAAILLTCLLTLGLVSPVFAEGEATVVGTCGKNGDNLTWTYDTESCVMTISGEGEMKDYILSMLAPWAAYREQIREVHIEEGVTGLGSGCFNICLALEKVTFPQSLVSIGKNAFQNDTLLTEAVLPNGLERLDADAFYMCSLQGTLVLPSALSSFGSGCFAGNNLTAFRISEDNPYYRCEDGVLFTKDMATLCQYPAGKPDESYEIPESVNTVLRAAVYNAENVAALSIPANARNLGAYAFAGMTKLEALELPEKLTVIPDSLVERAEKLTKIIIPNRVKEVGGGAFFGCLAATELRIGWSVESIGLNAFMCCEGLTHAVVPENVSFLGMHALDTGANLEDVTILNPSCEIGDYADTLYRPERVVVYGYEGSTAQAYCEKYGYTFQALEAPNVLTGSCGAEGDEVTWTLNLDTGLMRIAGSGEMMDFASPVASPWFMNRTAIKGVVVEEGVTSVGDFAFTMAANLEETVLSEGLTRIGADAFLNDQSLRRCILPESLREIGNMAFTGCPIPELILPENLERVGDLAFSHCGMTELTIPAGLTELGNGPFASCASLTEIKAAAESEAFCTVDGVLFSKDGTKLVQYPAGKPGECYELPSSVTQICSSAFSGCTLKEVLLPEGLEKIGEYAFEKCTQLQGTRFPDTLTEIDGHAFENCGFTELTIPDSVTKIGNYVFSDNEKLEKLHIGSGLTELPSGVFLRCTALRNVLIPAGIEKIGKVAFRECEKLKCLLILNPECEIYVDSDTMNGPETVICGFADSTAETWAQTNGYPFCAFRAFDDVREASFYYLPVLWASARGITGGTGKTTFSPGAGASRAQVMTFLWRFAGSPEPTQSENPFEDVADDAYYAKPILWAVEQGITGGVSSTAFAPDKTCTRAEFVTFLWAYAGRQDPSEEALTNSPFKDISSKDYFFRPVLWAYEQNVTGGTGPDAFSPGKLCSRSEIVTFLWGFLMN